MNIIGIELKKDNQVISCELDPETDGTVKLILESCQKINKSLRMVPHTMRFDFGFTVQFTDFSEDLNRYTAVWITNEDYSIKCKL